MKMNIVDEYILQRFPHKETGKLETDKPYNCRICWHRQGYPTAEELEKHCNSTKASILNYMSWYGWTAIKEHATNLQVKQEQIELRNRQKETEEKHRKRNDKIGNATEDYLDLLLLKLTDEDLLFEQRVELMKEMRKTRRELSSIQRDERTTEHLPNAYKDISGDISVDGNMDVNAELLTKLERPLPELDPDD